MNEQYNLKLQNIVLTIEFFVFVIMLFHIILIFHTYSPQSSKDPVFVAEFNPNDNTSIVTCGKSHVSFWTVRDEKLNKKTGLFEVIWFLVL